MTKKEDKGRKTITLTKDVWKKLTRKKLDKDYKSYSDLLEDLLKKK